MMFMKLDVVYELGEKAIDWKVCIDCFFRILEKASFGKV